MNTIKIEKLKCRSPKLFWTCWGSIALWMVACVVNTIWPYENQMVLDQIGFFVLCLGILVLLMLLRKKKIRESWKSIKDDCMIKAFSNDTFGEIKGIFVVSLFLMFCVIFIGSFILLLTLAIDPIYWAKFLPMTSFDLLGRILVSICLSLTFVLVLSFVLNIAYWAICYINVFCFTVCLLTTRLLSGSSLWRLGADFFLLFLVFVAFTMNFFPEWLVNSLVIISISQFLYDVYRIADLKREIPQGL